MTVAYTREGVTFASLHTDKGRTLAMGKVPDNVYNDEGYDYYRFTHGEKLMGLWGYADSESIKNMGSIFYRPDCYVNPLETGHSTAFNSDFVYSCLVGLIIGAATFLLFFRK